MKEQHPNEEQLKEMDKHQSVSTAKRSLRQKTIAMNHELGCVANKDRVELKCEVCDLGGFYVNKRVLAHKRTCHRLGRNKRMKNEQENDR